MRERKTRSEMHALAELNHMKGRNEGLAEGQIQTLALRSGFAYPTKVRLDNEWTNPNWTWTGFRKLHFPYAAVSHLHPLLFHWLTENKQAHKRPNLLCCLFTFLINFAVKTHGRSISRCVCSRETEVDRTYSISRSCGPSKSHCQ